MESKNDHRKTYRIREFRPSSDLDDAYECFVGSFYHIDWPIVDGAKPQLMKLGSTLLFQLDRQEREWEKNRVDPTKIHQFIRAKVYFVFVLLKNCVYAP